MTDLPGVPKRKKSRRNMRRITVPGDDVPRAGHLEVEVDLDGGDADDADDADDSSMDFDVDGDDSSLTVGSAQDEDDDQFDDEPTDPSVFESERELGRRAAELHGASSVVAEGSSVRHDSVVVVRSRIISDRPPSPVALPPPPFLIDAAAAPMTEHVAFGPDETDVDGLRTTFNNADGPTAQVRTKTPPPPAPGPSIMIAADYAQEVDEVLLRRQADDVLPPSLRPSSLAAPSPSVRASKPPPRVSGAPSVRDSVIPPPAVSSPPPRSESARASAAAFPEPVTGPRMSAPPAVPAVPAEARPAPVRAKVEAPAKPNPPAPHKPPPPPPKEPGVKRPPPWWKTFFSDDYLRSVLPPTPLQVKRQCDFVESVLGLPRGATILDVGCGTGLQAIELTERGYLVVGLDLSLPMITRAAEEAQYRNLRINFLHTDIREIQFEGAFDAVICLGTTFGFFDDDSNRNVLGRLRDALKPGGRLLLDVVNRDYVIRSQPNLVWFQGDGCVCMEESELNYFTSRLQVKRTMMHEDGRQTDAEYSLRLYSLHEIGQLLNPLGFRVIEVSGQPATRGVFFGTDSARIIALAERRVQKSDGETSKPDSARATQKSSLRPGPRSAKQDVATGKTPRDEAVVVPDLVEEEGSAGPNNAFDDDEETDPNSRLT